MCSSNPAAASLAEGWPSSRASSQPPVAEREEVPGQEDAILSRNTDDQRGTLAHEIVFRMRGCVARILREILLCAFPRRGQGHFC